MAKQSACRSKKLNSLLFTASGKCTVKDCPVTFTMRMKSFPTVEVQYDGNISHDISNIKCRQIKGCERQLLKETFTHGEKPLKEYLSRLNDKALDEIVAGNFDNVGTSAEVLRKISSESKHLNKNNDIFSNVSTLMQDLKAADTTSTVVKGFIQAFSVSPIYVFFLRK